MKQHVFVLLRVDADGYTSHIVAVCSTRLKAERKVGADSTPHGFLIEEYELDGEFIAD